MLRSPDYNLSGLGLRRGRRGLGHPRSGCSRYLRPYAPIVRAADAPRGASVPGAEAGRAAARRNDDRLAGCHTDERPPYRTGSGQYGLVIPLCCRRPIGCADGDGGRNDGQRKHDHHWPGACGGLGDHAEYRPQDGGHHAPAAPASSSCGRPSPAAPVRATPSPSPNTAGSNSATAADRCPRTSRRGTDQKQATGRRGSRRPAGVAGATACTTSRRSSSKRSVIDPLVRPGTDRHVGPGVRACRRRPRMICSMWPRLSPR